MASSSRQGSQVNVPLGLPKDENMANDEFPGTEPCALFMSLYRA